MKTQARIKAEKRQSLLSEKINGAINFELINLNQYIGNEVVISKNVGGNNTGITLENPKTGECRTIKTKSTIIENQPISYLILN